MAESSVFIPTSYLCGICESTLYNPKILKCFHVFCLRCLDRLSDRPLPHRITCPLCESETYISLEVIDRLDEYRYFYHSAIEHSNMLCQMCDKSNMATSMCKDCQEFMCKECNDYHKTYIKFKSHNVVSIDIEGNGTVVNDKTNMQVATIEKMCQEHDKYCRPMEEFCKACLKPVCSVCMLGFHKGHKTEPLQTTVARARTSLREASTALKSRLPFL
ncbi:TRIM2_3 [Mytilus edulis]|uniref:TRIM2_3 n=1 Tax=Mytilus edulis TaxID=6550 RepID=A0A8S3VHB2_MYTED|nr:TRIM2_3 [Mytilus edulis]